MTQQAKHTPGLEQRHYRLLLDLQNGADIIGYGEAIRCREIEKIKPKYIDITRCMGEYGPTDRLPYFGAISTKAGARAAQKHLGVAAIAKARGQV